MIGFKSCYWYTTKRGAFNKAPLLFFIKTMFSYLKAFKPVTSKPVINK